MRVGVIDVGTNTVRVLVAEGPPLRELHRDLVITRLGRGVDRTGIFDTEALRRTVAAIADHAGRCRDLGADAIRAIATSATRDARDRDRLFDAVRDAAGIQLEVIAGDEEAVLGFAGARAALADAGDTLVLDVGGGSTELVRGRETAERWISLQIGSVRLTERHVRSDPPAPEELEAVRLDAREHLLEGARAVGADVPEVLVGLAGTITTAAAVALRLDRYDRRLIHGARLAAGDLAGVRARLAAMTNDQRRGLPVMPPGREDVILAGVLVVEEAMEIFGVEGCVVSEADLLDGAARELLARSA